MSRQRNSTFHESKKIEYLNWSMRRYSAYVVRAEDEKKGLYGFIFQVKIHENKQLFPGVGQSCAVRLAHGRCESLLHSAEK